jgi:hypothetical protein
MGRLTVKFTDGSSASQEVIDTNLPIGKINQPAMIEKFLTLSSYLLERERAQKVLETVGALDKLSDVNELTKDLKPARAVTETGLREAELRQPT